MTTSTTAFQANVLDHSRGVCSPFLLVVVIFLLHQPALLCRLEDNYFWGGLMLAVVLPIIINYVLLCIRQCNDK